MTNKNLSSELLLAEIAGLRQEIAHLKRDKADLELLLEVLAEHSDGVTEDLHQTIEMTQREGQERFEIVTNTVPVAVVISRLADDVLVYANESAANLFAMAQEDLMGQSVAAFYSNPQERQQILAAIGAFGFVNHWEIRGQRSDSSAFWTAIFIRPLNFNGVPCLLEVYYDLSVRKRAEQELARFANQLSTAADVSAQISVILDPQQLLEKVAALIIDRFDLCVAYVYMLDPAHSALTMTVGRTRAGGHAPEQNQRISLTQVSSPIVQAVQSKKIINIHDARQEANHLPGPPQACSEILIPLVARDQVLGVLAVQSDQQNYFTQSDVDIYSTMAGQIATAWQNARLYTEAQQTAAQLREMDRIKGEFLATISHELQTPLNAILGYTQVLLLGIDGELNQEMQQDIETIQASSNHLLRLIHNILDLTQLEAGQITLTLEDINVAALLEDIEAGHRDQLQEKPQIEFQVRLPDSDLWIRADRPRLEQILYNLVSNAIKFTHQGHIHVTASRNQDWACITVQDTGIGIAEQDQERIFEHFYQIDSSNARQAEGLGLGLAISRRLVMLQGGALQVQSALGQGSAFTVCLPLGEPA